MTTIPSVVAPAIAIATSERRPRLMAQPPPLSVMTLPPSFRMRRSDIFLLAHAFRVDTRDDRPGLAGLDSAGDPVLERLGAERHHAPAPAGPRDLCAECTCRAG